MLFGNISKQNKQIISILIIINTLTLISLLTNNGLVINLGPLSISGLYFALFVFYVYFVYVMYNNTEISEESNKSGLEHLSLKAVVTLFLLVAVSIIVISSILTNVVDLMSGEEGYNLGNSLAGALLLSICTALPETVSAFSLAKMGQGNMAIGGIVGSHLFNLTILFYGDLFYLENATFDNLINSSDYQGFMGLVLVNVVISLFLFVSSNRRVVKNKFIYLTDYKYFKDAKKEVKFKSNGFRSESSGYEKEKKAVLTIETNGQKHKSAVELPENELNKLIELLNQKLNPNE